MNFCLELVCLSNHCTRIIRPCFLVNREKAMQLTKVLVVVSIVEICLACSIYETSKQDEFLNLDQATIEILKSCYGKEVNTVGLSGCSDGILTKALQSSTSISVTLLDSSRRIVSQDPVATKSCYKLQVFVITVSSTIKLEKDLSAIKNSVWWNHMASILILVRLPVLEEGCSKASEMLWTAWKMNLLNTKLMCLHRTKELLIYSFNPYMRIAPNEWKEKKIDRVENGHPWTLFVRRYLEGTEVCEKLDFDKTKDLGGYKIRSTVKNHPGKITVDFKKSGLDRLEGDTARLSKNIYSALNATPEFLVHNFISSSAFEDENGRDVIMDTVDGISDILLNIRYTIVPEAKAVTYPHGFSGPVIVTQYSGQMSQLSKIRSVVDSSSRLGICLVILITLLFFIISLRQSLVPGILNVVRLMCNGPLPIVPTNMAPRLYLCSLFVFIVTIQAIYQGKLATLLTKPVLLPNVNTLQDVTDGDYTLYATKKLRFYLKPPVFEGRVVLFDEFSCIPYVLHDPSMACVSDYYWALRETEKLRLHISQDRIMNLPTSYVIRDDWPLEARVNKVLSTMFETYIINRDYMLTYEQILAIRKFYENQDEIEQFKNISLDELSFAFVILGSGLGSAIICFIAEIVLEQIRSSKIKK